MSYDLPMDENLRGLLVELAEQPERVILSTRVRQFSDLTRPDVEVLKPTTGMGAVETKLIEAYRDELAHVLLLASRLLYEHSGELHLVPRDQEGRARPLNQARLSKRANCLIRSRLASSHSQGTLSRLGQAVNATPKPLPRPSELAIASLRLSPKTGTRIWLGTYQSSEGNPLRGWELQLRASDETNSGFLAAYAWSNIAVLCNSLHRFQDATEAARSACTQDPLSGRSAITWLLSSLQSGRTSEIRMAAHAVSCLLTEGSEELEENLRFIQITRQRGLWQPTNEAIKFARSHRPDLPATAEKLIEAFQ